MYASYKVVDRSKRQKVGKDVVEFNSTMNQLDLLDIYRILHPITAEYTFFSRPYRPFIKADHILGHTTHPNK